MADFESPGGLDSARGAYAPSWLFLPAARSVCRRLLVRTMGGLIAACVIAGMAAPPSAFAFEPLPGAAGLGDRLFPTLGNGGYDIRHYDLDLRYATGAPSQSIDGTVTIVARATQDLSRFDLDFAGRSIGGVSVNGAAAGWTRAGEELVVTPRRPLRNHRWFVVRVHHFVASPTEPGTDPLSTAFFIMPSGSATVLQPNFAHLVFPSNDHPSDKATFRFRFDVPAGITAVANGVPTGRRRHGSRAIWTYAERQPLATELVQLAVGTLDVTSQGRHRGILLRDVTEPTLTAVMRPKLALEPRQIDWMEDQVGRYPFDSYGSLVVEPRLSFALESQTLSIYDQSLFTERPQTVWEPVMVHELSHHWFGNSVSPAVWSDLWLNEGHATWYEQRFAAEVLGSDFEAFIRTPTPPTARPAASLGHRRYPKFNNIALFSPSVYEGGALVLLRPRQRIGASALAQPPRTCMGEAVPLQVGFHRRLHIPGLTGGGLRPRRVPARTRGCTTRPRHLCPATPTGRREPHRRIRSR